MLQTLIQNIVKRMDARGAFPTVFLNVKSDFLENFRFLVFFFSLAHSSKKQYGDAKISFERALELDPDNDSYKTNLEFANQKLEESMVQKAYPP